MDIKKLNDWGWESDNGSAKNAFNTDQLRQIQLVLNQSFEDGQKSIIKLAISLIEEPRRAVRYVPLDKLMESFTNQSTNK